MAREAEKVGGRLVHLVEKDEAPPQTKEKPVATRSADEEEQVRKFERQKIAEAAAFLERAGEVSNEMGQGLISISEEARGILRGPLNEEALLLLIQAKCPRHKNGDLLALKSIKSVLEALATLDSYLVRK